MPSTSIRSTSAGAEAARYALLRRLAPSMRHHLVVNLQPIGMIYEVMDRRLRAAEVDVPAVQQSAQKIQGFARAALDSCTDVVSWIAPDDRHLSTVHDGAKECASLLASSLGFRGYGLRSEIDALEGKVRRAAIRNVLSASLLHATDELPPPAEIVLKAQAQGEGAWVDIELRPGTGDKGFAHEAGYRQISWSDVQALAEADGVEVMREGAERLRLMFPWVAA
ncbi:hypothetical protein [Ramlibacter sp.]|uniref:hypothetical protein n=1 Tax=Ramlibacter sp. TaxID=1917967 RepID=UPI003D0C00EC